MYRNVAKIIRFDLRLIFYGGYSRLQDFDWRITFLSTFLTNQSADNARFNHNNSSAVDSTTVDSQQLLYKKYIKKIEIKT